MITNPERHKVKKKKTGTYNERSLYFQLIETTFCLIGFHGSHSNIMTSLAAAILDFHFFSNSN